MARTWIASQLFSSYPCPLMARLHQNSIRSEELAIFLYSFFYANEIVPKKVKGSDAAVSS